jgi:hypothetical protein
MKNLIILALVAAAAMVTVTVVEAGSQPEVTAVV